MILVIDTATAACSVALIEGDRLVDERHEEVGRGHAERLVPMIAEMIGARRPSGILVDCGPGSFTGVRVGLAAAHGLAIGWKVPLSGYSSLALLAASALLREEVAVALHAGHGQVFVQSFGHDPVTPLDELRSLYPADAAAAVDAATVVGSASSLLVETRGHGRALDLPLHASESWTLPAALRNLPPRPIYGRAPDAKPMR